MKCLLAHLLFVLLLAPVAPAFELKVLTNHVGYEASGPKHAVILGHSADTVTDCSLHDASSGKSLLAISAQPRGPVQKWRDWTFYTLDFDAFSQPGTYFIQCLSNDGPVHSFPFAVQHMLLERNTLSDAISYFKIQRSSGEFDQNDRHASFDGNKQTGTLDAHGGWWDASGDFGKHLSHLSFSTYFNPQQIPLVVYSLFKSQELLKDRGDANFDISRMRLLDEAHFGADYLVRLKVPSGSFYRSISFIDIQKSTARQVNGEMKKFGIRQASDAAQNGVVQVAETALDYEVSYRSGGGVAIAALAMASSSPSTGEYKSADYLRAAEDAFDFLEKNNLKLVNDGKENIVDDYCALTAATELYRATRKEPYKVAADRRAHSLVARLVSSGPYHDYWRADDHDRPFFHASDAGFPAVALLYYAQIADPPTRDAVLATVKRSLLAQLALDSEVNNPFRYARQLVQDKAGNRRTSFFFPHDSDAAPWWQGENARLSSLAAAMRLAAHQINDDPKFRAAAETFASDQLNWILGLNPFDASMMYGVGHNNPQYMYFDTWGFTNAPGGISNGITGGFKDESDIDFALTHQQTGADNDWRWSEQWLPHSAWYVLAVSAHLDEQQ